MEPRGGDGSGLWDTGIALGWGQWPVGRIQPHVHAQDQERASHRHAPMTECRSPYSGLGTFDPAGSAGGNRSGNVAPAQAGFRSSFLSTARQLARLADGDRSPPPARLRAHARTLALTRALAQALTHMNAHTHTCTHIHLHTHTQGERERERERVRPGKGFVSCLLRIQAAGARRGMPRRAADAASEPVAAARGPSVSSQALSILLSPPAPVQSGARPLPSLGSCLSCTFLSARPRSSKAHGCVAAPHLPARLRL